MRQQDGTAEAEPAFLTLSEAARRAGRGYSWARDRAVEGLLDIRRLGTSGRIHVTAASLDRLLAADQFPTIRKRIEKKRAAHLRLIVNNS